MGYEGTVKILSYLSKMLNGNIDLIEFIYQKKKIIEMNENLLYYLLLGLQTEKLYSYTIFSIDNATKIIYNSIRPEDIIKEGCIFYSSDTNKKNKYRIDEEPLHKEFFKNFMLNKIHYGGNPYPSKVPATLLNPKWCQKIILEALSLPSFISIRVILGITSFKNPTLKQKIKVLNEIVEQRGYLYLDLIKEEFKEYYNSPNCIILGKNGDLESIAGELFV